MSRTLKVATVQRPHDQPAAQLNEHLPPFLLAYNYAKRLRRLRELAPHGFVSAQGLEKPAIFIRDLPQFTLRPCTQR